jgi:predicted dehydrogenase
MKNLNIGMIGYGFMGRAHSNGYNRVNNFFDLEYRPVLKAVAARDQAKAKQFADKWGYESVETDWRKMIERKDIDAVDICTPNNLHKEIALACAAAGKMILCEKPLSMNGPEGEEMVKAVEKAGVPNTVWYNYRKVPAVSLAKQLIEEGRLGKRSTRTFPRAGRRCGGSTRRRRDRASPATSWRTASTRRSGSTATSTASTRRPRRSSRSASTSSPARWRR